MKMNHLRCVVVGLMTFFWVVLVLSCYGGAKNELSQQNSVEDSLVPSPASTSTHSVKDKWELRQTDDFTFRTPPSMKRIDSRGIDTFLLDFEGEGVRLSLEYGFMAGSEPGGPNLELVRETNQKIDGREFRIWEFYRVSTGEGQFKRKLIRGYSADSREGGFNLVVEIECGNNLECSSTAKGILESFRFVRKAPG